MDDERFDALARRVGGASRSRRAALTLLTGGSLGALLGATVFGHDPDAAVTARGKGTRHAKRTRDQAKRRRAKAKDRRKAKKRAQGTDQVAAAACGVCPLCRTCDPQLGKCVPDRRVDGKCCPRVGGQPGACLEGLCLALPCRGPICKAQTCPEGCCDAAGRCHVDEEAACGTGAGACTACTPPQTCGGGGTPGACGCTPRTTCPADTCTPVDDGCGGTVACECTPGDVCVGAPQTCQACSFATAQADVCSGPRVTCGSEDNGEPQPNCHCVRTTTGGAICTRDARTLCNSAEHGLPPICQVDADCVAEGYTHCLPATLTGCENCSGGTACAFACIPCPSGQRNCSTRAEVCCPDAQSCCDGVCCAPGERCVGPRDNRQCGLRE